MSVCNCYCFGAVVEQATLLLFTRTTLSVSPSLTHTLFFAHTLFMLPCTSTRVFVCVCCVSECVELYWLVTRLGKKNRAAPAAAEPSLRLRRKQKQRTLSATIFATGVLQQVLTFNCGRLFSRAASNTTIFLFSIPRSCFLASQFCIIKNFQTNHPLNSTYYIFCLSTAKNAYIFIKFLLFFLFCVARIFTAACCRCFIVVAAGLVVIASNLFLYGCTHVHVYVFLFTKNFQPKINMQFFQLLHNYRQSTFILLRFYCSASVFCCIFCALFFSDNCDDGGGGGDDDGQKQEDKFLCTISLLLCVAFVTLRTIIFTANNYVALILYCCCYHSAPIEFLAF